MPAIFVMAFAFGSRRNELVRITPFSFIHCADLHLDSPFEGVYAMSPNIASALRDATFESFDNIIDLAIREHVDFLIVAGDVYDGADRSLRAQWRFHQSLRRAVDSDAQCFIAHGNHDPLSGWEAGLTVPDGVYRFNGGDIEQIAAKRGDEELAHIYGVSYPSREIRENLALRFPHKRSAPFTIGVLHCNVGGDPHHDNYAPCTVDDLVACEMDYWALGHIHTRSVLREREPRIVYPGNIQGRSIRELGPRGCYLVKVDEAGLTTTEFIATDIIRWFIEEVDIAGLETKDALIDTLQEKRDEVRACADGRSAMLRIHLTGRGDLHKTLRHQESDITSILREGEEDRGQFVWTESVKVQTRPTLDISKRRQIEDFVGEFLRAAEELRTHPDATRVIRELLTDPREHSVIAEQLEQLKEEDLLSILEDAEISGLDWLLEGEQE